MVRLGIAALAGGLFGAGLVLSGLANPHKVLNFLDVVHAWDPSLLVVMAVAAGVTALGYRLSWSRGAPLCDARFQVPENRTVDQRLLLGAVLFGMGWGLTGYCPGPALTALAINPGEGAIFVLAMIVGALLEPLLTTPGDRPPQPGPA